MKDYLINGGLLVGSITFGFLVLELITRQFMELPNPYPIRPRFESEDIRISVRDNRGFWTIKPNYRGVFDNRVDFQNNEVTVNAFGARRVPCSKDVKSQQSKIYLIGDSQTFGWGLSDSDTWANKLQCQINSRTSAQVLVINLGYPGAQVDQLYSRTTAQVMPVLTSGDTVIVSFTWNDLITYYTGPTFVRRALDEAGLKQVSATTPLSLEQKTVGPQIGKSSSPGDLTLQLDQPPRYLRPPSWRYPIYRDYGVFVPSFDSPWSFLDSLKYVSSLYGVVWSRARLLYYRMRPSSEFFDKVPDGTFASNFIVLKALDTIVRRKGARMYVQLLPNRLFFDDYYYRSYSKNGMVFPEQDYLGYIARTYCEKLELFCLNRFEVLATNVRDRHTFGFDGHYNRQGAQQISKALKTDLFN